jgi:hypothetical protein
MQRADALCDLDKDVVEDGFVSSAAGRRAWDRGGDAWLDACSREDAPAMFDIIAAHDVDLALLPATVDDLARRAPTGGLGSLLAWTHGLLAWRYARHAACARAQAHPALAGLAAGAAGWGRFVRAASRAEEALPCSAR